jgi:hypothetical protein
MIIRAFVEHVTFGKAGLRIRLNDQTSKDDLTRQTPCERTISEQKIAVSWAPTPTRRRREIVQGAGERPPDIRPMRIEAQRALAAAYGKARSWLDRLVADPTISIASIAGSEGRTERSIRQTLSLAFLDPSLVDAAMEGRLPRGFGLKRLRG